jgi:hydrogenase nickel incorporation protein HypA/HybF
MHELSIALSIVDGVLAEAQVRGLAQVSAVHLRLGRLSGVDKDALQFSYGVAAQDTVLATSRLVIDEVEVVIFCSACGAERETASFPLLVCAQCGTLGERVIHGDELEISAVEVTS